LGPAEDDGGFDFFLDDSSFCDWTFLSTLKNGNKITKLKWGTFRSSVSRKIT
jgi:hypothetical protein